MAVCDVDELSIAASTLVGEECKMGVALLAVGTDNQAVVVLVGLEEVLDVRARVNVDLCEGVVGGRLHVAFGRAGLEPGKKNLEAVALLDFGDKGLDRAEVADGHGQVADEIFASIRVQESTNDHWSAEGIDALDKDFDVLGHVVGVEIGSHVVNHVEAIANNDEGKGVGKASLLEEVLHALGVVAAALTADALNFLGLANLGGSLDVTEVDFGVLAGVDDGAEVVVKTLEAVEGFKEANDGLGSELLSVLCGDLDNNLEIHAHVDLEELLQALEAVLNRQGSKEVDKELRVEVVCLNNDALDIADVREVLQGALGEAGTLAHLSDLGAIVVGEHLVSKDGIGHLRSSDEVDFQETGLEEAFFGAVGLENVEQIGGGLLEQLEAHEGIHNSRVVHEGTVGALGKAQGEGESSLGICAHNALEDGSIVGLVTDLLCVEDDFVVGTSLGEALDNLSGCESVRLLFTEQSIYDPRIYIVHA